MYSLVTLTLLILPEVRMHPLLFLCVVLGPPGPMSCSTVHLYYVPLCPPTHGSCRVSLCDEVMVCFDPGQNSSMSLISVQLPLGPHMEHLEHTGIC